MTLGPVRARFVALATLALLVVAAPHAVAQRTARTTRRALEQPASVAWRNAPLGPAVRRLMAASRVPIWIDRRIDPTQRVTFVANAQPLGDLLDQWAEGRSLGTAVVGGTVYLGPLKKARYLTSLPSTVRRGSTKGLIRRGETSWPRLTTPREVVDELAEEAGFAIGNPESIPHDLWDAGRMEDLAVGDRLTLVLLGFDLRWSRPKHQPATIRIDPIAYEETGSPARRKTRRDQPSARGMTEQRFTLQVQQQPALSVLRQLAKQLQLKLVLDQAPESLRERRITFAVDQATRDGLFAAIADAAGVTIDLGSEHVLVRPAHNP